MGDALSKVELLRWRGIDIGEPDDRDIIMTFSKVCCLSKTWLAACALFVFSSCVAASSDSSSSWSLLKSTQGIDLYKRMHQGGLVEIKASMLVETSFAAFLLLLDDTGNADKWLANVRKVEVLEDISPLEKVVYTQFKAPWPVTDRDMVTYSIIHTDGQGVLNFDIEDFEGYKDSQKGFIRIHNVKAKWLLEKTDDGKIKFTYTAFANPGGALPRWLINHLSLSSANRTFVNLRKRLVYYNQPQ